jgi:hypothetical protein
MVRTGTNLESGRESGLEMEKSEARAVGKK